MPLFLALNVNIYEVKRWKGKNYDSGVRSFKKDNIGLYILYLILPCAVRTTYFRFNYGSITGHTVQNSFCHHWKDLANEERTSERERERGMGGDPPGQKAAIIFD